MSTSEKVKQAREILKHDGVLLGVSDDTDTFTFICTLGVVLLQLRFSGGYDGTPYLDITVIPTDGDE